MVVEPAKSFPPRGLTYLSVSLTIGAAVLFAVVVDDGWSWPLFVWGTAAAPVWVLLTVVSSRLGMEYVARQGHVPRADLLAAKRRSRGRFMAVYPAYAALGLPFGIASAATQRAWPDVGLSVYAVLAVVLPLLALPRLARRAAARAATPTVDDVA